MSSDSPVTAMRMTIAARCPARRRSPAKTATAMRNAQLTIRIDPVLDPGAVGGRRGAAGRRFAGRIRGSCLVHPGTAARPRSGLGSRVDLGPTSPGSAARPMNRRRTHTKRGRAGARTRGSRGCRPRAHVSESLASAGPALVGLLHEAQVRRTSPSRARRRSCCRRSARKCRSASLSSATLSMRTSYEPAVTTT